jgi:hypothetical protein
MMALVVKVDFLYFLSYFNRKMINTQHDGNFDRSFDVAVFMAVARTCVMK